jgi:hypothetical protein
MQNLERIEHTHTLCVSIGTWSVPLTVRAWPSTLRGPAVGAKASLHGEHVGLPGER